MKALMTLIVVAFTIPFLGALSILGGIGYLFYTYVYGPCTDGSTNDTKYFVTGLLSSLYAKLVKPSIDAGKEREANSPQEEDNE